MQRRGKALVLQQSGLLRGGGHGHGKACAPQLLLRAQVVQQAGQDQTALSAQAVEVTALPPLQRDWHRQCHSGNGVIFLGHIDILLPCKTLHGVGHKFFRLAALALPQRQHSRLVGWLHQTIHLSGCPLLSNFMCMSGLSAGRMIGQQARPLSHLR